MKVLVVRMFYKLKSICMPAYLKSIWSHIMCLNSKLHAMKKNYWMNITTIIVVVWLFGETPGSIQGFFWLCSGITSDGERLSYTLSGIRLG